MMQKFYRLVMLEIADSRSRKKTDTWQIGNRRRNFERQRKVGDHRMNRQPREIAAQLRRVLLHEVAGNIDGDIRLDRSRGAKQNTRLLARTRTEFDQGAVWWKQRSDRRRIGAQERQLAPGRIVLRQLGDAFKQ